MNLTDGTLASSFRDPSGFLFRHNETLYRQINKSYSEHYQALFDSGLYQRLVEQELLISHQEVATDLAPQHTQHNPVFKIIEPEPVSFISYPYEWSFSQLKDAALATLDIQLAALAERLTLKDASAYNIQFHQGKAKLIDTLSFEKYIDGQPWIAYRQFCQHFLAPLALQHYTDIRLGQLSRLYLDGVPLDLASRLLPKRSRFRWSILTHIHLHALTQRHYADKPERATATASKKGTPTKVRHIPYQGLIAMTTSLRRAVERLSWEPKGTEWANYYQETNYSDDAFDHKRLFVAAALNEANPKTVWDLGANDGTFSRLASDQKRDVVAFDIDPSAVEKNYRALKQNSDSHLLPLIMDLTNPSPALGWSSTERDSLSQRSPADLLMALALIHHLAISNNVPLDRIAEYFSTLGQWLLIEFVPKHDSQVEKLLATREDIFPDYHQDGFVAAFAPYFETIKSFAVPNSAREIYFLKRR